MGEAEQAENEPLLITFHIQRVSLSDHPILIPLVGFQDKHRGRISMAGIYTKQTLMDSPKQGRYPHMEGSGPSNP